MVTLQQSGGRWRAAFQSPIAWQPAPGVTRRLCSASAADLHVFQKIVRLGMDDNGGGGCSRVLLLQLG